MSIEVLEDGTMSKEQMCGIPCPTLTIGHVEFVSQADGSMLLATLADDRYSRVDEYQAMQLFIWLSNHMKVKLSIEEMLRLLMPRWK